MKMLEAILSVAFAALAAWPCAAPLASPVPDAQAETTPAPLKLLQTIPIPGLKDGDFDHFTVDLAGHRLFLTAEKNSAVEVFDLNATREAALATQVRPGRFEVTEEVGGRMVSRRDAVENRKFRMKDSKSGQGRCEI